MNTNIHTQVYKRLLRNNVILYNIQDSGVELGRFSTVNISLMTQYHHASTDHFEILIEG